MLNSRESLLQRLSLLGDSVHKDLLIDVVDSAWQWSRKEDSTSSRNRTTIVGGQKVNASYPSSNSGSASPGSNSNPGGSSGAGNSSSSMQQVQSDWKVSDSTSV